MIIFEEISVIDSITVKELGQIEVRRADKVLKDGVEIAKSLHRHVLNPGADTSAEDPKVQAIASATWTPEVIDAWEALNAND